MDRRDDLDDRDDPESDDPEGDDPENDDERHLSSDGARRANKSGGVLLSQGISPQVPSALRGLTSVFGMGTGVTLSPRPPEICCQRVSQPEDSRASTSDQ